jgi:Immunity protein 53
MIDIKNVFEWLQQWYKSQCDGDWEHEYGITIETVDNPGWYITINLIGTECDGHSFSPVKFEKDEMNWYFCLLRNNNFEASCGPCNLEMVLQIFQEWVKNYPKS